MEELVFLIEEGRGCSWERALHSPGQRVVLTDQESPNLFVFWAESHWVCVGLGLTTIGVVKFTNSIIVRGENRNRSENSVR